MNEEEVTVAIKVTLNENSQLQESQKQLLYEAEVLKEKVKGLNKQKTLEDSKVHAEQVLRDKENHIKSLTEHLLQMKDWASVFEEVLTDDGNLELEMKSVVQGERDQIFTLFSELIETKEDLIEHIKNLKTEQASLQSKNTQFKGENQNLQQKLKVMIELHQENVMKLQRKLIGEENYPVEREEKLYKMEKNISHATEQLETYRKQVKDLEEELERTIHSYQGPIMYCEKKAHGNELAAQSAERYLNDLRKQNAHDRQNLTENEFEFKLVEKDPSAIRGPLFPVDPSVSS
ncbi:hypothetical protein GHT09_007996 [Marmota monax]|uniref:Uncharacterized protein n=1 Tax=Marmota monax TaxID=9995 RepID=A0A834V3Z4_MARMO|nr:hypothetical protein GHT09_007996 [Marmota monax]